MCNYDVEIELSKKNHKCICGIDEVGRGALFGPVVAGAVILNPEKLNFEIKDSKQLSPNKRIKLAHFIYEHASAYSIGWCWNDEIDDLNIVEATKKSMKMAVRGLQVSPGYILMDGMDPAFIDIPGHGIVKGDTISMSIAAASIIAKVFRDQLIISFAKFFPGYLFENNKGYPTKGHIAEVSKKGMTDFHRRSYRIS